jgi:Mg/Co/Ni transporter MgtE
MASAKQSSLDRLYKLFVTELTDQLKGTTDLETGERTPPNAALLAVIGQTLFRAGVKPTNDNPHAALLGRTFADLPFREEPTNVDKAN